MVRVLDWTEEFEDDGRLNSEAFRLDDDEVVCVRLVGDEDEREAPQAAQ